MADLFSAADAQRAGEILSALSLAYPDARSELNFSNNFELLVAVMLSAQCTDRRVNIVTPRLFAAMPTPEAMAAAGEGQILGFIESVTYPSAKAHHLWLTACSLVRDFGSQVPSTLEELLRLPGVGRKTANVVLVCAFSKAAMPVDTHVFRVAHRLALSSGPTPSAVERDLMQVIPARYLKVAHLVLVLFGRYTCVARFPLCGKCPVAAFCTSQDRTE